MFRHRAAASSARVHADRAARRHRDHRRPDRPAPARRAGGPRGGPARRSASTTSSRSAWRSTTITSAIGVFPPGYVSLWKRDGGDEGTAEDDIGHGWGWGSMILPQLEQTGGLQRHQLQPDDDLPGQRHGPDSSGSTATSARPTSAKQLIPVRNEANTDDGLHGRLGQLRRHVRDRRGRRGPGRGQRACSSATAG